MVTGAVGIVYLVTGALVVAAFERWTDGGIEREGSTVMVGLAVVLWPVVTLLVVLHLLGRAVRPDSRRGD